MNIEERKEIEQLPEKYRPMSAWSYFWLDILFAVPVVGFIFLIVFSFNNNNISRRNFARSFFCAFIVVLIIFAVILVYAGGIAGLQSLLNRN